MLHVSVFVQSDEEDQSESEALSSSAALPPTGIKSPASETEEESRDGKQIFIISIMIVNVCCSLYKECFVCILLLMLSSYLLVTQSR